MPSFFDKLKKGVGIENIQELQEEQDMQPDENLSEEEVVEETMSEEAPPARSMNEQTKKRKKQPVQQKKKRMEIRDDGDGEELPARTSEQDEWFVAEGELAVDMYHTDDELVVQAVIGGLRPEELDVTLENDMVIINGERRNPNENEEREYEVQECYWGPFSRKIILPSEINIEKAEASMKNGIFTIRLPKIEEKVKSKKLKVRG